VAVMPVGNSNLVLAAKDLRLHRIVCTRRMSGQAYRWWRKMTKRIVAGDYAEVEVPGSWVHYCRQRRAPYLSDLQIYFRVTRSV
jgi:hypothetical protein